MHMCMPTCVHECTSTYLPSYAHHVQAHACAHTNTRAYACARICHLCNQPHAHIYTLNTHRGVSHRLAVQLQLGTIQPPKPTPVRPAHTHTHHIETPTTPKEHIFSHTLSQTDSINLSLGRFRNAAGRGADAGGGHGWGVNGLPIFAFPRCVCA